METINETTRQPTEWEKIFANDATERAYFPKYTNSSYSSIAKNKQTNLKMGKRPKLTFLQRRHTGGQ